MINVRRIDKQFRTCRSGRKSWWDAASFVYLSWSGWPELMDLFIRDDVVCLFIIDHDLAWIPWSIHVTYVQNKFWKVAFGRLQYSTRGLIRKIWLLGICLWPASSRRGCYFLLRQKVTKNRCRQNGPSYSCLAYHSSRLSICSMPTSGPGRSYLIGGRIYHWQVWRKYYCQFSYPMSDQIMRRFSLWINIKWFRFSIHACHTGSLMCLGGPGLATIRTRG